MSTCRDRYEEDGEGRRPDELRDGDLESFEDRELEAAIIGCLDLLGRDLDRMRRLEEGLRSSMESTRQIRQGLIEHMERWREGQPPTG